MLSSQRLFSMLVFGAWVLASGSLHAQTVLPEASSDARSAVGVGAASATGARAGASARGAAGKRFVEKFAAANTTRDGRLTLAQARGGKMSAIARNFASIDQAGRGYVTLPDIRAWRRQVRAERDLRQNAPNLVPARPPGGRDSGDPDS